MIVRGLCVQAPDFWDPVPEMFAKGGAVAVILQPLSQTDGR